MAPPPRSAHVQLARDVLAERADDQAAVEEQRRSCSGSGVGRQAQDATGTVIGEDVASEQPGRGYAAVDEATDDGTAARRHGDAAVSVDVHRWRRATRVAVVCRVVADVALEDAPAEVAAPSTDLPVNARRAIDLLPTVVADIADPQVVADRVDAPAPRIAQAVGPDLIASRATHEGVVSGDAVWP